MTAIQTNLQRTYPHPTATPSFAGPVWTALIAFVTLGFGPAFFWASKWARFVRDDRRFWMDVISAIRPSATTHADASALDDLYKRLNAPRSAPFMCSFGAAAVAALIVAFVPDHSPTAIWDELFGTASIHGTLDDYQLHEARNFWQFGLFAVFIVQWYAVRSYVVNVSELVKWTNRRAKKVGGPKAKNEATRAGLFPWWVVVAVAFSCYHAWWAIPMAMTGALARRYARVSSGNLRAAVSRQLDSSATFQTVVGPGVRYCAGPGCGRRLPDTARFCPRCGTGNQPKSNMNQYPHQAGV